MIFAEMNAGGFHFRALSEDEEAAKVVILNGWNSHCRQYGYTSEFKTVGQLEEKFDISLMDIKPNSCYRDYAQITQSDQPEDNGPRPRG